MIVNYIKYMLHVVALLATICLFEYGSVCQGEQCARAHGRTYTIYEQIFIYPITAIQLLVVLAIPQIICNFLGLIFFNPFTGTTRIDTAHIKKGDHDHGDDINDKDDNNKQTKLDSCGDGASLIETLRLPHFCFRVVTRGLYPELVQENVHRNYLTCTESGLRNFSIEVVTDKDMYLNDKDPRVRKLVVPGDYRSATGAMFKARALQYALEPGVSPISSGDYIVHLDEETMLTRNSINGIINFALEGRHHFGQGLITYANLEIVNIFTTLADSYRVADDMGKLRFTLAVLHSAIFGWKGSFVVTRYEAEQDVSFDHGPDGSVAEDCYFSMVAYAKGYSFDFIQGEMHEKSPFTITDLIRQRKRWIQGIWLVVHTSKIPFKTKIFLAMSHYAWLTLPITSIGFVIALVFQLPTPAWLIPIGTFCFSVTFYMYIFGLLKSFDLKSRPIHMFLVYLVAQIFMLPLSLVVENVAVIWGLLTPKHNFYIVQKDKGHKVVLDT